MSTDPRLPDLFAEACELTAAERRTWLADLQRREPALAAELATLLAAGDRGGTWLDSPPPAPLGEPLLADRPPAERLGPYRIVREIGRGGMGRVYLAEEEGEHFHREVALKVLEHGDLGTEAVRRFRDEVRILASLEHPGIARFLDGGRAEDGTWFLALEYVEGVGLLDHATAHELDVDARVRLFLAVLEPVEHAHGRLVVHRDLKPANILVGADGRPRLLDFGISKLIDPEAGDDGTLTRTELRAFTPAYASPEQFRGERATVASDVYSLGVILYELLAGVRPYRTSSSSRAELERAVLEEDPEPPSTASRRGHETPEAGNTTERRRPRVGRDLDAICLQALRKQPADRYASAAGLADDLRRYLAGQPVSARRGGRRYRLARLVRRNRARVATAGASALVAGALVWGALHQSAAPPAPRPQPTPSPRPFPLTEGLGSIEELQRRFAASPESIAAGASLVSVLVREGRSQEAALVIGRLRQLPGGANDPLVDYSESVVATNLDEPQRALALSTRALATAQATGRGELVARVRAARARSLSDLGRRDEARAELERALREAELGGDQATLARTLNDLAIEELSRGRLAEGERLLQRALAINRAVGDRRRTATILHNLAGLAMRRGRPDLAEPQYREAATTHHELGGSRREAMSLGDLAHTLFELGRPVEAGPPLEQAIATLRRVDDDTSLAYVLTYRAAAALDGGRLEDVAGDIREIETAARASGNQASLAMAEELRGRAAALRGDLTGGRRWLAEARRILEEAGDVDLAAESGLLAAAMELAAGNRPAAARLAEQSAASYGGGGDTDIAFGAATLLARADCEAGRLDAARHRLAALGPAAERRPSVPLRLRFLATRAALARAEGRL
ncbi:MAG TPA: serine/threonine-protein kinase, partial [Thermoanaerobaculia bacterium]|nr:serine/threonine-protein kinase [Thermoanaerobaculia bacterium]